ncbi:MAG: peptide chain release factor 1 [bacterium]|nr:peptide chain release factor 1 [bacterium]
MQTRVLLERLEREVEAFKELESKLADPAYAEDPTQLKELSREHARMRGRTERIETYLVLIKQQAEVLSVLEDPDSDEDIREMAQAELAELTKIIEKEQEDIEYLLLPPDPHAGRSVIMEIRAGTGGDEAGLFVGDLLRMYTRLAERRGLRSEMISAYDQEVGGYREVILSFAGPEAYDLLHQEGGAHRVQRIPVTESGGRIHTSACTVAIMPEADEEEVEIDDKDLQIDVYRASGAGGQHVNKTESAIRITHIPSGVVVTCQDERSQHKNKAKAMRVLRTRLAEQQERERHAADAALKKEQVKSGDRSERIRTYNFPQGRVTDHRIGFTAYNLAAFMEGEMDDLLEALLRAERDAKLQTLEA